MRQTQSLSLETLDPDLRDSVRDAARRAGLSIEDWVAATITGRAGEAAPPRRRPARPAADDFETIATKIGRLAEPRPAPRVDPQPRRDIEGLIATAAAESERRSRETTAKTAVALDAVARWIETAEERLDRTARTTTERGERTQAVLGEALGLMTRRLDTIERKIETGHQPALDKALKAIERIEAGVARAGSERSGSAREVETALRSFEERIAGITERLSVAQPAGRRSGDTGVDLRNAVAEIRARKVELDGTGSPLEALRADIARLAGRIEEAGRPAADPAAAALQAEMAEIRRSLAGLATRDEVGTVEESLRDLTRAVLEARDAGGDIAAVSAPVAELQAEVRRLAQSVTDGLHDRLSADFETLARRIDRLADRQPHSEALSELARGFVELRADLARLAEPQQVAGLAHEVAQLGRQVAEIGRSQVDAVEFAGLKAAIDEVRAHMRAAPRDGALQDAAAREIAALSAKLDRLAERVSGGDGEAFARMVETLSAKIDRAAATPPAVADQIKALSDRMETVLLSRGDPAHIEPLVARLDRLDESLRQPAAAPDLKPLEDMLRGLAERLDGGDRQAADPDGLDALERQVAAIAQRLDRQPVADPAMMALQQAMGDLLSQVEGIRDESYGLAERAAKTAVATTLKEIPAGSGELNPFRRDIDDLKALHGATDRRNRDTLEAVHVTLEKLVDRLSTLEADLSRPARKPAAKPAETALPPEVLRGIEAATRGAAARPSAQGAAPTLSLGEADRAAPAAARGESEILLEPGARPRLDEDARTGAQAAGDMKAALIAQARRAAQAAAADAASAARPGRTIDVAALASVAGGASGVATRVRQAIQARRRPILLGLAAIVLAIGTLQVVGGLMAPKRPTETAATAPRIEAPAAPVSSAAAPAREVPARDVVATPPSPTPSPEPPAPEPARDRGASAVPPRPAEPARLAAAEPEPVVTSALPKAPAAASAMPAVEPTAPALGPIANMASVGDIPSAAGLAGLRSAALAGDPAAVYDLASRASEGRGLARDLKLAARLFESAAAHGLVPAQFRVANHYEKGLGVAKDPALAKTWYQRAAEKGNARAMHNLAVLLAEGAGAKPDYAAAAEWFRRAAEHGVRDSQFNLAVLMGRGLGTKQDLAGAYTWFALAAKQGDEDAGRKRDEVAGRMNPGELALARAAVERWRAETPARWANEVALPAAGWSETSPKESSAKETSARPAKKI